MKFLKNAFSTTIFHVARLYSALWCSCLILRPELKLDFYFNQSRSFLLIGNCSRDIPSVWPWLLDLQGYAVHRPTSNLWFDDINFIFTIRVRFSIINNSK